MAAVAEAFLDGSKATTEKENPNSYVPYKQHIKNISKLLDYSNSSSCRTATISKEMKVVIRALKMNQLKK